MTRSQLRRVGRRGVRFDLSSTAAVWIVAAGLLYAYPLVAQQRDAPWTARWIGHADVVADGHGVLFLRRVVNLDAVPARLDVHVSADNRYRLFVNGTFVAAGPARGDLGHWRYETIDLAPLLEPGPNVIAAVVWNYGSLRPVAQISRRTGFVVQSADDRYSSLNTGAGWKALRSRAHSPIPVDRAALNYTYIVVGPGERLDGAYYPWGWEGRDFDDRDWTDAADLEPAHLRGHAPYGAGVSWQLIPREIPMMEEREARIPRLARVEQPEPADVEVHDGFLRGERSLEIPPAGRITLLLDRTVLTTGYPVLRVGGGARAVVRATYAEALVTEDGDKGHRDEIDGKTIRGYTDEFVLDGGPDRTLSTLWWRTFRFIQLEIETASELLSVHDVSYRFTAYPFEENGSFESDHEDLSDIWDVGWRTARLCAGETYFDCPYYEQLQYVGDTRIQALISLYVSGDDRLMRKAILDFDHSRVSSGLTASRYPSAEAQFIPPYSLFWIAMVYDYWMHRDDADFVEARLHAIRGVLDWYESYVDATGMLGPMPWWNFVDWAYTRSGVPPGADDGHSAVIALQYAYVLDMAAEMSRAFGRGEEADEYLRRSGSIKSATRRHCWDDNRRLFADTPDKDFFTEHTNVMAVLVDLVPETEHRDFMQRILDASDLLPTGFYYRFYLHRALKKAGLGDRYVGLLDPWREMLAVGLTTFAENPGRTRSDCHAWSASPNYDFQALVVGIVPDAPGFRRVRIAPSLGPLRRVKSRVPHPGGDIDVELAREGEAGITGTVGLPAGVEGVFEWNGVEVMLREGVQAVRL